MTVFKRFLITLVASILIIIAAKYALTTNEPTSFQDCVKKGYPTLETYPAQCRSGSGKTFTQPTPGATQTTRGTIVCLPHKNTSGPQTLECAYGLKAEDGRHYGLTNMDLTGDAFPVGSIVNVTGSLIPDPSLIYDTVGNIQVTTIEKN